MDVNKHNKSASDQDPDDLIAELARLVAQDARNTSSKSDDYRREEPSFEPAPSGMDERQDPESFETEPAPQANEFEEPADGGPGRAGHAQEDHPLPAFDFGLEPQQAFASPPDETQHAASVDPIADLIADAEVEAYARDSDQDSSWSRYDEESMPAPEPQSWSEPVDAVPQSEMAQPIQQSAREPSDPLSEIEALIGEAARLNADPGAPERRVKSSFLDNEQTDHAVDAAESAILAAAAATGAQVRRVETPIEAPQPQPVYRQHVEPEFAQEPEPSASQFERAPDPLFASSVPPRPQAQPLPEEGADEEAYDQDFVEPPIARRRRNGFVLPVVAGAVIVALIGGTYFAFFSGPGDPGEAPVLTADASPLKEDAEPVDTESTASESVVFNEIEGNTAAPEDETLVSRDQTGGENGSQVTSVATTEEGETALVNRPVRTVTVRPDGTIVQAEDSVAGSNVLPVDRPDVPEVPNSTLTSDPIGDAIAQAMAGEDAALVADASAAQAGVAAVEPAESTSETPLPLPRPTESADTEVVPTLEALTTPDQASVDTTGTAAPAGAADAPSTAEPAAWVQLSSQRSEEVAQAGMAELQTQYGSLFNGATPEVSRVDLGERGIYYRVRLPQPSLSDANSVCSAIQGQGGDCFVLNN